MKKTELTYSEQGTVVHALQIAAERYDEHVKTFTEYAETAREPGSSAMTPEAARRLADQFRTQAADARTMMAKIDNAETITIEIDPENEEE
jgi:hypothetical protein